jgi:hypothetical protein
VPDKALVTNVATLPIVKECLLSALPFCEKC